MSQWESNAACLAGSVFSLSQREGFVWPTSERPMCPWQRQTDKEQASLTLVHNPQSAVGLYGRVLAGQEVAVMSLSLYQVFFVV